MWIKLPSTEFFIHFTKGEIIEIYLTDFVTIWSKYFSSENFLNCVKNNNKNLEGVEESELLKDIEEMLKHAENLVNVNVTFDRLGSCDIHLVKRNPTYGYPVKFALSLTEGSKDLFFQKITYPLLESTQDLLVSQNELCSLLIKKDNEIKEYKEQGVKIGKYLKTPTFKESHHKSTHNKYYSSFNFNIEEIPNKINICTIKQEQFCEMKRNIQMQESNTPNTSNGFDLKPEDVTSLSITNVKQEPVVSDIKLEPTISCKQETQSTSVSPRKKKKIEYL